MSIRYSSSNDTNPRPFKRQKVDLDQSSSPSPSSALAVSKLKPLPPSILLVTLPALVIHPPNHRYYAQSLCTSLLALRKCLTLNSLTPDIECRAWTALAEVGMKVIGGGFSQSDQHAWAQGIEAEVETAIDKALLIAQKHPSLRAYRPHLIILSANLSQWQHSTKYARTILRRLLTTFIPSDPPHIIYNAHLALISHLINDPSPQAALSAVEDLHALSLANAHPLVTLLTHILRLRILVSAGMWNQVGGALQTAEEALRLDYSVQTTASDLNATPIVRTSSGGAIPAPLPEFTDQFNLAMLAHTLIIGVLFHTYSGVSAQSMPRLAHLHMLLDSGKVDKDASGIVEVPFTQGPPLQIQTTPPRILYLLAFLVSSTAKRDAVGRKPKRKLFAVEGLLSWEREAPREIKLPAWAGLAELQEEEDRMAKIKADLLSELVGVTILRSEFDAAEGHLADLIAHTRTYSLFESYAPMITLHHGHLAHALGQTSKALQCYRVAASLAQGSDFINIAAKAGEVAIHLGLRERVSEHEEQLDMESMGMEVAKRCQGMGGTLGAVGKVIEAGLTKEILKAKHQLKQALDYASKSQDNHLRALVLALIASHYFYTSKEHAQTMLTASEQLAAGLGASATKTPKKAGGDSVGNAVLRLWVGERFLELHRRAGDDARATKQAEVNRQLSVVVTELAQRGG